MRTQNSGHLFVFSNKSFVSVPEILCLLPAFRELAGRLLACEQSKVSDPPRSLAVHCLALTSTQLLGRLCLALAMELINGGWNNGEKLVTHKRLRIPTQDVSRAAWPWPWDQKSHPLQGRLAAGTGLQDLGPGQRGGV